MNKKGSSATKILGKLSAVWKTYFDNLAWCIRPICFCKTEIADLKDFVETLILRSRVQCSSFLGLEIREGQGARPWRAVALGFHEAGGFLVCDYYDQSWTTAQ